MQQLSLGYSPCPNDTFIFHAITHDKVDCGAHMFEPVLKDVEALNQDAKNRKLDVTKLSFAALGHLQETYGLLRSGAALGRGCGPIIVARPGFKLSQLGESKIAVPGLWTTANLLLGLYLSGSPEVVPMTFDRIMPAVANGELDFGVIIHEGRFTYHSYGLTAILDLGQWWEEKTGLPIPLGGIAIRRSLGASVAAEVEKTIQDSIRYAFKDIDASRGYIKKHAQEVSDDVIARHIDLYVNDDSIEISAEGVQAIEALFQRGRDAGLLPNSLRPLFSV